jgi:amidase
VIGPIARNVEDLALALQAIAGEDGRDPSVAPVPMESWRGIDMRGLRVAWWIEQPDAEPTPETATTVRRAVDALHDAGAALFEARPDTLDQVLPLTHIYQFMSQFDLMLLPAAERPAVIHGEDEGSIAYTLTFSLTGQPAVVVPYGRSPEGLPIGVQIAARPWRDHHALAAAHALEATGGWWPPPGVLASRSLRRPGSSWERLA